MWLKKMFSTKEILVHWLVTVQASRRIGKKQITYSKTLFILLRMIGTLHCATTANRKIVSIQELPVSFVSNEYWVRSRQLKFTLQLIARRMHFLLLEHLQFYLLMRIVLFVMIEMTQLRTNRHSATRLTSGVPENSYSMVPTLCFRAKYSWKIAAATVF